VTYFSERAPELALVVTTNLKLAIITFTFVYLLKSCITYVVSEHQYLSLILNALNNIWGDHLSGKPGSQGIDNCSGKMGKVRELGNGRKRE